MGTSSFNVLYAVTGRLKLGKGRRLHHDGRPARQNDRICSVSSVIARSESPDIDMTADRRGWSLCSTRARGLLTRRLVSEKPDQREDSLKREEKDRRD